MSNQLAFVIPTRNRRTDLWRMLESIRQGTVWPDQLIVVDGGDDGLTVANVTAAFPELTIDYERVFPPSLSRQRNAGMARVRPGIALAGYLDDDLVLERGAVEAMLRFWQTAGVDVGGAGFNITNVERPPVIPWKSLFLLEHPDPGVVRQSGYHSMICPVSDTMFVQWLFGGATVWRRSVIDEFPYDEWFEGTGFLEDVDYSYAVGRQYRLAVVADARLEHLSPPIRPEKNYVLGKWQVINRLYFVRKHGLSTPQCLWALLGQMIVNGTKAVTRRDPHFLDRLKGNLAGALSLSRGRFERVGGILK